jgi:hypothetical protein
MADHPWIETTATVASCELISRGPRLYNSRTGNLEMPVMARYAVTFTYYANGHQYSGQYISHEDIAHGHNFTICYDPKKPQDNSGSENSLDLHPFARRVIAAICVVLIVLGHYWWHHRN